MKPEDVKITQIAVTFNDRVTVIIGLGNDQIPYRWNGDQWHKEE